MNSNHYEVQPVQIDLKNFSVQTMAKANTIPNPLKPSPPSRPPPPRIARRGLLGRPIPIADQNGSIYTITVAKNIQSARSTCHSENKVSKCSVSMLIQQSGREIF
jgi:hypothetical protein